MQSWPAAAGGGEDAAGSPGGPELLRWDADGWRRKGRKRRERHGRKSCRLACPDAGTEASVLGVDWTPFSAQVRCVEWIYLQSSTRSPHSTGTRTGKLLASPRVLRSDGLCRLSSRPNVTAVGS